MNAVDAHYLRSLSINVYATLRPRAERDATAGWREREDLCSKYLMAMALRAWLLKKSPTSKLLRAMHSSESNRNNVLQNRVNYNNFQISKGIMLKLDIYSNVEKLKHVLVLIIVLIIDFITIFKKDSSVFLYHLIKILQAHFSEIMNQHIQLLSN